MKAPVGLLSDRTVLRSKMEGLCPDKFQFVAHVPSRVLGTGTPNKKRSQKGKDFQNRFRLPGQAEKASSPMSAPSRCWHGTFSYPKRIHRWQGTAHWTLCQKGAFRANSHRSGWSFDRACDILGLVQQLGSCGGNYQ